MPIYLTNPEHGTHIVYSESEADRLTKIGWTVRTEEEIDALSRKKTPAPIPDPISETLVVSLDKANEVKPKRGRPRKGN